MNEEDAIGLCPSDVMINDWVYDSENECNIQITIKEFRNDGNNIFFYQPIPLTKELLEYIGGQFNTWKEGADIFSPNTVYIQRTFYQFEAFVCEVDDTQADGLVLCSSIYGNTAYIRHFHELQHALKLCGMTHKFSLA